MTTLADLTLQVAKLITRVASGTTTALGTTTTLIDTVGLAEYPDDNFNGGTVWITSGTNDGKTRPITDFVNSSKTLTFSAFAAAVASGVTWEAASADYVTYADLRQAVNLALREIGKIRSKNDTLAIVDDQLVYALPTGVFNVRAVEVLEDPAATDEKPKVNNHWDEVDGNLVFEYTREPSTVDGTYIRIWYSHFHTEMTADTDALSSQVDEEYLVYLAARQAMRLAYKRKGKGGDETLPEWLNEVIEEAKKHVRPNRHSPSIRIRTA